MAWYLFEWMNERMNEWMNECLTTPQHEKQIGYWVSDNEGKKGILFNDTFNAFYLRLYGVRLVVKDHWDSDRGNPLPPLHGLLFPISSKRSFICTIPTDRITHTTVFVTTSCGALAGTSNSLLGPPWRIDTTTHCTISGRYTTELHLAPFLHQSWSTGWIFENINN